MIVIIKGMSKTGLLIYMFINIHIAKVLLKTRISDITGTGKNFKFRKIIAYYKKIYILLLIIIQGFFITIER